jgi:hypothetical protein
MRQRAREALGIDVLATLQDGGDAAGVVSEGEQAAAALRPGRRMRAARRLHSARRRPSLSIHGMSGEHHAVDFLVGGGCGS